jgi:hypothetical protein
MNPLTKACIDVINGNATKTTRKEYHKNKLREFTYVDDITSCYSVRFDSKKFNIAFIAVRETLGIKINEYPTRELLTKRIVESRRKQTSLSNDLVNLSKTMTIFADGVDSLKQDISLLSSQKATLEKETAIGSDFPSCQMRYIIFSQTVKDEDGDDEEVWKFHFASRHTSHSALLEHVKEIYGRNIGLVSGGFYSRRSANGLQATFGHSRDSRIADKYRIDIILYGRSDSFGLRVDHLSKAIEQHQREHKGTKFTVLD